MLRRPSALPECTPPSPRCAQCTAPLAHLALLPALSSNVQVDWLVGSAARSSPWSVQTPLPPLAVSSLPAPRTVRGCSAPIHTSPGSHSIPPPPAAARPAVASADNPLPASHTPPSLPTVGANIPGTAPRSPARTTPSRTATLRQSDPLAHST